MASRLPRGEDVIDWSVARMMLAQGSPDVGDEPHAAAMQRSPAHRPIALMPVELHAPQRHQATGLSCIAHVTDGRGYPIDGCDQPVGKPDKHVEYPTRAIPLSHGAWHDIIGGETGGAAGLHQRA